MPSPQITVVEITTPAEMDLAWSIRRKVFIEAQRVPEEIEMDADDAIAFHVLARDRDLAVGCGRMVTEGDHVEIGRMAVLHERRGEGIGRRVLEFLMNTARRR